MKRSFRLTRPTDFERVRHRGRSYAHPLVVLTVLPNDTHQVRLGVAAGRSLGGAVQRNRAKRLLRAAARPLLEAIAPGHDLALVARRPLLEAGSPQVQAALRSLLAKAGLMSHDD